MPKDLIIKPMWVIDGYDYSTEVKPSECKAGDLVVTNTGVISKITNRHGPEEINRVFYLPTAADEQLIALNDGQLERLGIVLYPQKAPTPIEQLAALPEGAYYFEDDRKNVGGFARYPGRIYVKQSAIDGTGHFWYDVEPGASHDGMAMSTSEMKWLGETHVAGHLYPLHVSTSNTKGDFA